MPASFSSSANYSASVNSATKHGKGGAGEGTTRVIYKTGQVRSRVVPSPAPPLQQKRKGKGKRRDRGRDGADDDGGADSASTTKVLPTVEILCIEKALEKACTKGDTSDDGLLSLVAGPLVVYRPRGLRKGNRATNAELEAIFSTQDIGCVWQPLLGLVVLPPCLRGTNNVTPDSQYRGADANARVLCCVTPNCSKTKGTALH